VGGQAPAVEQEDGLRSGVECFTERRAQGERDLRVSREALGGACACVLCHVDDADGRERFVGLDHGVLVKAGARVTVAAMGAVTGESLADLRDRVRARFVERDAAERAAQTALARLESGVVRRILDMEG